MKATPFIAILLLCCLGIWSVSHWSPGSRSSTPELPRSALVETDEKGQGAGAVKPRHPVSSPGYSLVAFDLAKEQAMPEGPVASMAAELLPRAEAGDVEAMRRLYLALQRCTALPTSVASEPMYIDPAYLARTGMTEPQAREMFAQSQAQADRQRAEDCRDVTPAQRATAGAWLRRAAEAGDPYAQLAYSSAVEEILGGPREMLANPEAVMQFRRDSIGYLEGLARRGMPDAMMRLSAAYASGVLTDRDMTLAYGYGMAAEKLIGGLQIVTLDEYRKSLSAEQLRDAQALARSLDARLR